VVASSRTLFVVDERGVIRCFFRLALDLGLHWGHRLYPAGVNPGVDGILTACSKLSRISSVSRPCRACGQPLGEGGGAGIGQPQALRKGGRHLGGFVKGREIDKADPVWKDAAELRAGLVCETGLADTRGTGQGEQPSRAVDEQLANQLEFLGAAQEGRWVCLHPGPQGGGRGRGLRHAPPGFVGPWPLVPGRIPPSTHVSFALRDGTALALSLLTTHPIGGVGVPARHPPIGRCAGAPPDVGSDH
jgi:hypothetical protein